MSRIAKFYAVGLLGVGVQLGALAALAHGLRVHYLISTVLAVELAILHNFCWHEHWTWPGGARALRLRRLWRFHVSNGVISILSNVVAMRALVDGAGLPYVPANAVAIGAASIANYLSADLFVFRGDSRGDACTPPARCR